MKLSNLKTWALLSPAMHSMLIDTARNVGGLRAALAHIFDECVAGRIPIGKDTLADLSKFDDLYGDIEAEMLDESAREYAGRICSGCKNWNNKTEFCAYYKFRIKNKAIVGCIGYI